MLFQEVWCMLPWTGFYRCLNPCMEGTGILCRYLSSVSSHENLMLDLLRGRVLIRTLGGLERILMRYRGFWRDWRCLSQHGALTSDGCLILSSTSFSLPCYSTGIYLLQCWMAVSRVAV